MQKYEVVLPKRVAPQPLPAIVDGGDCGACVLAGIMDISVEEAYGLRNEPAPFSYHGMTKALDEAERRGLLDRVVDDIPMWPHRFHQSLAYWGFPSWQQNQAWIGYVRMALDAGYYGIAHVDHGQKGLEGGDPDHVVMICGVRHYSTPHPTLEGAGVGHQEVLVSCSSTTTPDEEWVSVLDFLRKRGGYNAVFVRPIHMPY